MTNTEQLTPLSPLQRLNDVEQLVNRSLLNDWILRIEHAEQVKPRYTHWQQWGKDMFAVEHAGPVTEAILGCRANHPRHSVRLVAEKVRPEMRFVYCVYRPQDEPSLAAQSQPAVSSPGAVVANGLQAVGPRTRRVLWQLAALGGMVLASLFLAEEAMSASVHWSVYAEFSARS